METGASWATNSLTTRTVARRAIRNLSRRAAGVSFDRCAGWERLAKAPAERHRRPKEDIQTLVIILIYRYAKTGNAWPKNRPEPGL